MITPAGDPATAGYRVHPIGLVHNGRHDPAETDEWGGIVSTIEVDPRFGDEAFAGLTDFSHVEVLFLFDRTTERDSWEPRSARGRADLPAVGVFVDRGPRRPNLIGATICRIAAAHGRRLRVIGLDAVDGTPVIDIKPVMRQFLPGDVRQPDWVDALLSAYF